MLLSTAAVPVYGGWQGAMFQRAAAASSLKPFPAAAGGHVGMPILAEVLHNARLHAVSVTACSCCHQKRLLQRLLCVPCLQLLEAKRVGVVAHFYMDPQVQGVLTSAGARWPHIAISDSLVMADKAVRMG